MITIIDYGLGNIKAFANVYERLNVSTKIAHNAHDLVDASKIILPGVGSFDHAMNLLNDSGMREQLDKLVCENNIPVMGICLGMQLMAKSSEEGCLPGLGWIDGEVKLFDSSKINFKTQYPHMGWNTIKHDKDNSVLNSLEDGTRFYFLHSYYFLCHNPEDILTTTNYGINYASSINKNNIYGFQFHPEKSHSNGVQLLKNFASL